MKTGIAIRSATVNIIYKHVLLLSPVGKSSLTSGEITNLVAVDCQKLYEVTQEGHLIWALPLSILLVTWFLCYVMGPSTLVGIVVLIAFLPIINLVTKQMTKVRSQRVKLSDERVEITCSMLMGIRSTKLNGYETKYKQRVEDVRSKELSLLAKEQAWWATTLVMTVSSPVLATGATFATYVLTTSSTNQHILTAADTFGVLLLFGALRFPINFAGRLIGKAAQALSAVRRISSFLQRPLQPTEEEEEEVVENGGVGCTSNDGLSFTAGDFSFELRKGQVLVVCGPVGSGKSTLINGILDEADRTMMVQKHGQYSYGPQDPFILNQSLRENILFGTPLNEKRYNAVLDACALRPDIQQLGGSDLIQIGERGVTLSGGQRQRISLARAAYKAAQSSSSCIILDDPFSALDAGTGKIVFERLIASPQALLKNSAVLLVTHASHFISHRSVDQILLMVNGRNQFMGTWDELTKFESSSSAVDDCYDEPTRQVAFLGFQFEPQINGLSAQYQYLKVYAIIVAISLFSTALRSEFTVTGGVRATKNVFNGMLGSVLRAPMSYFETVPMGRILNRFTYDTDVNDVTLTQVISMFIISCSWYVASIVVQVAILPWSAFVLFPISGLYLLLMHHYRHTGPDLQRIDALSRSPLQSMVSECLEGSTSIRIFHQDRNFITKFENIVDVNSSALLNYVSVQRWLGIRMEVLGSLVVLTTSVLVVCLNEQLNTTAGLAGLLITWTSNFTITLNFLVDTFSETEAAITAIERVDAMAELPSERSMETETTIMEDGSSINALSKSWPQQGLLEFKNVFLRYRDGLPLALNDLSFEIPAGKTCGIVGRTGAGKSSITVALFRLVEIESGQILLDGIDLSTLGLSDVRGRGMSIIPQDPFLAGANLRECLDPFEQRTDGEIMEALQSVRMGSSTATTEVLLSMKLEEGGSNYSVGERQLLNLARALLSQPKVLVLDEATASIDGETDAFIQRMLRTRFPNTTLVTIAHRLNTVMDYDCVLVMDNGRASEFDSPTNLLSNEEGIFSQLVDATGIESSKALRQMAVEASASKL
ncbi:ATP-binding cassette transporter [Fragilariopsis cylindrus CCMP1102]|uniref:ATP-binding cassette transporter n=1 Tax=Fragilariopsis cylindrus CCMP1102 TaxID=635003 RepID=A0A1E7EYS0_9STRA|nr:ATP-binding cassette transporter [Fragilariopsis cylindrus CCMP1102]|eukprot:OEU11111.1 ATP-binding cassette transporter [Fragilariopsis cylindrus CCMP1102]